MVIKRTFSLIEEELTEVDNYLTKVLNEAENETLHKIFMDLLKAGGKRIRPAFALLSSKYGTEDSKKIIPLAAAFELVHMASLIHDDVIDRSELRRGLPTVRARQGNNFSLHYGDYLFGIALNIVESYKSPRISSLLAQASVEMCKGEIEQLATSYELNQRLRDYFYRINRKTALLITLSCQAGALASGAPTSLVEHLGRFGHCLGMAFQITDDVLDYIADEETMGKPVGGDLQLGLVNLPVIYVLKYEKPEVREELRTLLKDKPFKKENVFQAIEIIKTTGAIEYSLSIANLYIEKGLVHLERLPDIPATQTLRQISFFIYNRRF